MRNPSATEFEGRRGRGDPELLEPVLVELIELIGGETVDSHRSAVRLERGEQRQRDRWAAWALYFVSVTVLSVKVCPMLERWCCWHVLDFPPSSLHRFSQRLSRLGPKSLTVE